MKFYFHCGKWSFQHVNMCTELISIWDHKWKKKRERERFKQADCRPAGRTNTTAWSKSKFGFTVERNT